MPARGRDARDYHPGPMRLHGGMVSVTPMKSLYGGVVPVTRMMFDNASVGAWCLRLLEVWCSHGGLVPVTLMIFDICRRGGLVPATQPSASELGARYVR